MKRVFGLMLFCFGIGMTLLSVYSGNIVHFDFYYRLSDTGILSVLLLTDLKKPACCFDNKLSYAGPEHIKRLSPQRGQPLSTFITLSLLNRNAGKKYIRTSSLLRQQS